VLDAGGYYVLDTVVDAGPAEDATAADAGPEDDPCLAANKPVVEITQPITTSLTFECKNDYLLRGQIFVQAGATLTIQAGTRILGTRGDVSEFSKVSVLVVQPGGKIEAVGTEQRPIVFTSAKPAADRRPGDWGGLVLLGKARVNQGARTVEGVGGVGTEIVYGGNEDDDSSGTLKYVRIEYGGYRLSANNEINGLTFAGVGRGTMVDFVQVRMVLDDCFEFFGGTVNAKHLACQYAQDDGIDWDFGYQGKIQFAVVQQDPNVYDDMNGLEGDNGGSATEWVKLPTSAPVLYNLTLCGAGRPVTRPTGPDGGLVPLRSRYGLLLRRHTRAQIGNSIVMGFEAGFDAAQYPNAATPGLANAAGSLVLRNVIFFDNVHGPTPSSNVAYAETAAGAGVLADDDEGYDEVDAVLADPMHGNRQTDPQIGGCYEAKAPSFGPAAEISAGELVPPADGFFVPVGYIGAFRDIRDPWATNGWTVWDDR